MFAVLTICNMFWLRATCYRNFLATFNFNCLVGSC